MSGPIVRKYGFPNFEKIFGEKPVEHGVDEPESNVPSSDEKPTAGSKPEASNEKTSGSVGSKTS